MTHQHINRFTIEGLILIEWKECCVVKCDLEFGRFDVALGADNMDRTFPKVSLTGRVVMSQV